MDRTDMKTKKIYIKPALNEKKMTVGVYGDYDRVGKDAAAKLSDAGQLDTFER